MPLSHLSRSRSAMALSYEPGRRDPTGWSECNVWATRPTFSRCSYRTPRRNGREYIPARLGGRSKELELRLQPSRASHLCVNPRP